MKSISTRFLIPFGLLAILISILVFYQAYETSRKHSNELINRQAALALEFNLAIRDYAAKRIRPVMENLLGKDEFIPETMSTSLISRVIFDEVRKKFPEYIIRFSSNNPRNPLNLANPDELRMIEYFREKPQVDRRTEEIQIDGKRYLAHFTPKWMKQECMRCHDDPKDAPAELLKRYGATASFHRTVGDVAGLDTVAVPLEAINAPLASEMRSQVMILAGGLALLFGTIFFIFRFVVIRRLATLANHFNEIAAHAESPWITPVEVKGNDEISVVGVAFNKLVEQLHSTQALLEQRVSQRTEELQSANRQLQLELGERKRAQEALNESQQQLADIIDFLPDATFVVDSGGKVIAWNHAMEKMTGAMAVDMLGKGNYEYALPFYGERRPILIDLAIEPMEEIEAKYVWTKKKGEVLTGEAYVPMLGGGEVFLSGKASTLHDSKGNIVGAIESIRDITERKRAEAALAESKRRFTIFMDHLPAGVFIKDQAGRLLYANRFLRELFNWDKPSGKTTEELIPREIAGQMVADDRRVLAEGPMVIQEKITDSLGNEYIFDTHKFPITADGAPALLGGIAIDMTRHKQAEQALKLSEKRWQFALEGAGDGVWDWDLVTNRVYFSDQWKAMLGYATDEVGDSLDEWDHRVHPEDKAAAYADLQRHFKRGTPVYQNEHRLLCKDGSYKWIFDRGKVIEWAEDGKPRRVIGTHTDITKRKQAEEERKRLEERLQRAEKMEALGTLAGGVAHDLNNVLGVVVGYSELLLYDSSVSNSAKSKATEIMKGGQKAAAIVRDLLTLARRGVSNRKILNLNNIILECRNSPEFTQVSSFYPNIRIKNDLASNLLNISGSAIHLGKSLMNLVSNAAEAMPEGGLITIKTKNQYMDRPISGYDEVREGDYVVLTVSDTGEGIPAGDLGRIFEPFYTKKVMGRSGTGLGLSVVWSTVKDHLGYINVESVEGKKTTFTLYFPVTREEISPEHLAISAAEYTGNGQSILIVDDVEEQRALACTMLTKLNYTVISASSGEEAVEYLKQNAVDLLVLDMIMVPGMDGLDTYSQIIKIHPHQRAIIVSGFSETERVSRAQALGAGAYVRKPYGIEELGLAVKKELDRKA
ncbi:MAG: PAS domain S-box protein [Syntrophobacteraceae bacterium]